MAHELDVKALRKSIGLTQEQLAALMGITAITINRWEHRRTEPTNYQVALLGRLELAAKCAAAKWIGPMLAANGPMAGLTFLLNLAADQESSREQPPDPLDIGPRPA